MRLLLILIAATLLWYLIRSLLRHYFVNKHSAQNPSQRSVIDPFQEAQEARFRDIGPSSEAQDEES